MATLPKQYLQHTIKDMKVGESGYTLPWAMLVRSDLTCLLNGSYPVEFVAAGTCEMPITRTEQGFQVHLVHHHQYNPTDGIPWVGATPEDLIPVAKLLQ